MPRQIFLGLVLLCGCIFYGLSSSAQAERSDSVFTSLQVKHAIGMYNRYTAAGLPVYNGLEYIPYNFKSEGHAFFGSDSLVMGAVAYGGRYYRNIPMLFDLVRNELVITNYDNESFIILSADKIDSFDLFHHRFVQLFHNDSVSSPPVTGFYDLLYDGRLKVWVRRTKDMQENTSGGELVRIFSQHNHYYIFKDDRYYPADSKKAILAVLHDRQHEIRKYARRQKIKFRKKDFDPAIAAVASYYDILTR